MTQAQPFTILLPYLPNKIANKNTQVSDLAFR